MIYFALDPKARRVKIGMTDDIVKRIKGIHTGASCRLRLMGCIAGEKPEEDAWHDAWAGYRRCGEYFALSRKLVGAIRSAVIAGGEVVDWEAIDERRGRSRIDPFRELVEMEPRLLPVFRKASAYRATAPFTPKFCANSVWYGYYRQPSLKGAVSDLVGFMRRKWTDPTPEELCSSRSYDIAYQTCYSALPNCRKGCDCGAVMDALLGPIEV